MSVRPHDDIFYDIEIIVVNVDGSRKPPPVDDRSMPFNIYGGRSGETRLAFIVFCQLVFA